MRLLIKISQTVFALALIVYGIEQFIYGTFRNVFFSPYQEYLPLLRVFAYLFGLYLLISALFIITGRHPRKTCLMLGTVLFALFLTNQLPYQFISEPNKIYHLGLWVNQLKCLALSGASFVVAGSFNEENYGKAYTTLNRFVPYGNLFFLLTMGLFGTSHCLYAKYLVKSVPEWMPDHELWIYLTGIALISAAVAIALGIRIRVIALLLGLMIFCWFWMVHLPGAIRDPKFNRAEYVSSAADAIAFSGIAVLIALTMPKQKWVEDVEAWK